MSLSVSIRIFFIITSSFGCDNPTSSDETVIFSGITETDANGNMIGNIDSDDWCPFDMNLMDSGYGLILYILIQLLLKSLGLEILIKFAMNTHLHMILHLLPLIIFISIY